MTAEPTPLSTLVQFLPIIMTLAGVAVWAWARPKHRAAMDRLRAEAAPGSGLWDSLKESEKPAIRAYYTGAGLIFGGVALTTYLLFF